MKRPLRFTVGSLGCYDKDARIAGGKIAGKKPTSVIVLCA